MGGENFQRHIAEIEQLIQHDSGLALGDILRGIKHRCAGVVPGPLDHARHHGSGYRALGPGGDGRIIGEAGGGHIFQRSHADGGHGHGEKFCSGDRAVGVKEVLPVEIGTDEDALLGQADGGLVGGIALHIGVGHFGVRFVDLNGHLSFGGGIAR